MARKKLTGQRSAGPSDAEIGLRLRAMRTDNGLSQSALADRLGVTFQQVQKYERGVNRLSLSRAVQIVKLLSTSIDQLTGADGVKIADGAGFDLARYKLAQSLEGLDSDVAHAMRRLAEIIKKNGGKKRQ